MNSPESNASIRWTEAPSDLRIPISLVRCSAVKETNANRPRHARKTATMAKTPIT